MSIEAIAAIAPGELATAMSMPPIEAAGGGFGGMVAQGLEQVNAQLMASQSTLQNLAVGDVQSLHQVMISLEEAKMSFQLMMQVRNRLLEAYQDVMKMPV